MKKFITIFAVFFVFCANNFVQANEFSDAKDNLEKQNKVEYIGFKILNFNGIEKRMIFTLDDKKMVNAYANFRTREIVIGRGIYDRLQSDDEIAAVISHEISHGIDSYRGIFRGAFSGLSYIFRPKKYEYKADKRAVDFMVHAGYNPVAMIVVMNKTFPQYRYDWLATHPLTTRRMMEIYEYIYKKYPEYLAHNVYKNNIYYQNFLLTSQTNREKLQNKIKTNSKSRVKYL